LGEGEGVGDRGIGMYACDVEAVGCLALEGGGLRLVDVERDGATIEHAKLNPTTARMQSEAKANAHECFFMRLKADPRQGWHFARISVASFKDGGS
jgi:hypothetical protein